MKGSDVIPDSVNLLLYHLLKTSLKRTGSLKNKKATINPKSNNNNCFRYALTVSLNYKKILKKKYLHTSQNSISNAKSK